jgi:lactose/L-arabinose transport system permease protein
MNKKRGLSLLAKQRAAGWAFLTPATLLIFIMSFWPMVQAFIISFKTGSAAKLQWAEPVTKNYTRMLQDKMFQTAMGNTFLYLVIQVPIMLVLAILLAQLLNNPNLKFRGLFRTCIFLPCAISLVSYALIFRSLFATQGLINSILMSLGIIRENINWLGQTGTARGVIIFALIWRWTGYNMVFYLAGLQNLDYSVYEAAHIDGCTFFQTYARIIVPMLKPVMATIAILSFRQGWNEYILPRVFTMTNDNLRPLTVGVNMLKNAGDGAAAWNIMFAGATIAIVPILVVFICFSRYFMGGLTSGAVKG